MADGIARDELTKLRLKVLEQKIRSQSSRNNTGLEVYHSSSSGFQQLLQVETLKSEQLLQRVKDERQHQKTHPKQNHNGDNMKEMMTLMMSQNMQLQQLLLQQINPLSAGTHATESTDHSLPKVRTLEDEQIGNREMTPFTSFPVNRHVEKAKPPSASVKWPPVPAQRKPSPKPLVLTTANLQITNSQTCLPQVDTIY